MRLSYCASELPSFIGCPPTGDAAREPAIVVDEAKYITAIKRLIRGYLGAQRISKLANDFA